MTKQDLLDLGFSLMADNQYNLDLPDKHFVKSYIQ